MSFQTLGIHVKEGKQWNKLKINQLTFSPDTIFYLTSTFFLQKMQNEKKPHYIFCYSSI